MFGSALIRALISEVVTELHVPYSVGDVIESRDRGAEWFAYVSDPTAPHGSRVFQIVIEEDMLSNAKSIKEQAKSQLWSRFRR